MPIYEYECEKCRRVLNFLVRNVKEHQPPVCPKCGHKKMHRVLSRFAAVRKSAAVEQATSSNAAPPGDFSPERMPDMSMLEGLDENDPRSMGRVMRKLAQDSGEQMPPEMDEMCRRLEAGEDPEKIEESMGEMPGSEGAGLAGDGGPDDTLYE